MKAQIPEKSLEMTFCWGISFLPQNCIFCSRPRYGACNLHMMFIDVFLSEKCLAYILVIGVTYATKDWAKITLFHGSLFSKKYRLKTSGVWNMGTWICVLPELNKILFSMFTDFYWGSCFPHDFGRSLLYSIVLWLQAGLGASSRVCH